MAAGEHLGPAASFGTPGLVGDMLAHAMGPKRSTARAGRPHKTDAERDRQRLTLLECAMASVREHGPTVTVDAIADNAGYSKPLVYELFGSKSGFAMALGVHVLLGAIPLAGADGATDGERVRSWIGAFADFVERDPEIYRFVVVGSRPGTASLADQPLMQYAYGALQQATGLPESSAPIVIRSLIALAFAAVETWSLTPGVSKAELVETVATMVMSALDAIRGDRTRT